MPVYKINGKANKVQPEKLQSTTGAENSESHTLLKDKLPPDDKTPSLSSIDESTIEESHAINADSVSPSYEVIDGTTVYFDNNPSVQPSFVSEVAHATALPNEQASVVPDSEINPEKLSSDKNTFIDNKELQPGTNDASSKFEGIQLSVDTQKQTSSDVPLENLEAINGSTLDTVSKDDTSMLDESSKSEEELIKNVDHRKELDSSAKENAKDNEKEKVTEPDGIFASITKTLKILSNLEESVTTESATIQSSDDTTTPEITVNSNLQLEDQVPKDIGVKDAVTEKILSPTQIKLESNIDQSFIDKEKKEIQQEIIHESIKSVKVSDEKIKEASTIILENTTPSSDVPLLNNFVRKNTDKPAKELPTAPPILTDNNSTKADVEEGHVKNIQMQELNEAEKVEDARANGAITSDEENSRIVSNVQETVDTKIIVQSSDDIEQKLPENGETHLENTKKDYKETIGQADKTVIAEILETINLPSETTENITTESLPENHSVGGNVITEEALNHSIANIQFNKESIVYSNVNKNDNLVNDASSDNVPIESDEFLNNVKSDVLGPEQFIDSSQENMISEQTIILNEVLKKQDLSNNEENLKQDSKLLINSIEKF